MRVLVIEDDASIAELIKDYLEINNFACDLAHRGDTGLEMALNNDYDLLIVDIMLPGKEGFEICSSYREQKNKPIIILSAKKEDIDKIRALGLGADDYVTKPFSPNELVARVKSHISRYGQLVNSQPHEANSTLSIRGLKIDIDARRVFLNNEEVIMPAKEFDLLLFLAQNPNRVFNKDLLFDRIWGMDAIGDVATVTVHIQRIREKIEIDSGKPQYIETVWGAGYRFKV